MKSPNILRNILMCLVTGACMICGAAGLDEEHTLPQLAGSGTVHVKEWGGPKGFIFVFK